MKEARVRCSAEVSGRIYLCVRCSAEVNERIYLCVRCSAEHLSGQEISAQVLCGGQ
jgi:DNA-directed RNA polymerase subunit RPC12/RpoP